MLASKGRGRYSTTLRDEMQNLKANMLELKAEKDTLMGEMKEDEIEMFRFV